MNIQSDDKLVHLHTKSFLNLVQKISEAEVEIGFENYSNTNPIFDMKTKGADQKADTSSYKSFMEEDASILNTVANKFQQIDEDMAKGMGKKK